MVKFFAVLSKLCKSHKNFSKRAKKFYTENGKKMNSTLAK